MLQQIIVLPPPEGLEIDSVMTKTEIFDFVYYKKLSPFFGVIL